MMKQAVRLLVAALAIGTAATVAQADVAANWQKHCASCHGKDGKGATKAGKKAGSKDFTDAKYQESFDDAKGLKSVKEGQKEGDKEKMKPFASKLSDDEIKELIGYVRKFKK